MILLSEFVQWNTFLLLSLTMGTLALFGKQVWIIIIIITRIVIVITFLFVIIIMANIIIIILNIL